MNGAQVYKRLQSMARSIGAKSGVQLPTRDVDAEAVNTSLTIEHLTVGARDVVALEVDDGVVFDLENLTIREIREQSEYPGLRVKVAVAIGSWKGSITWDVSTGDPIVPAPRMVELPRLIGEPIRLLGYAPETSIAEKGVTTHAQIGRGPHLAARPSSNRAPGGGATLQTNMPSLRFSAVILLAPASHARR